ncbi:substrate-binding domain-containing protein [Vibrio chagasii]|nr:substrate-binding domain-containing protein [Vibrio chagasii]
MSPARVKPPGETPCLAASLQINAVNLLVEELEKTILLTLFLLRYASTSSLVRQIERGAPADIFISANEKWMTHLARSKLCFQHNVTNICERTSLC